MDLQHHWAAPGPEVTRELFLRWQDTRRGAKVAEDMTNPVWDWLFRGRIDPYHANEAAVRRGWQDTKPDSIPSVPRWAGCRLGQSRTELADGRVFWIAGEHEDYYDPDFYIYNDVIVESPDGAIKIIGYPTPVFRPTDFHTATAIENCAGILIIGSLGYPQDRRIGHTQVYHLNTQTFEIRELQTAGEQPGWIRNHSAQLSDDEAMILINGGEILTHDGSVENIDQWSLHLPDLCWTRVTNRQWPRWKVGRADGRSLHLWQYDSLDFHLKHTEFSYTDRDIATELAAELGTSPNLDVYRTLYRPSLNHKVVEREPDADDWRTTQLLIDGVKVRIMDELDELKLTVEGDLSSDQIENLVEELRSKLSLIENTPCIAKQIG